MLYLNAINYTNHLSKLINFCFVFPLFVYNSKK